MDFVLPIRCKLLSSAESEVKMVEGMTEPVLRAKFVDATGEPIDLSNNAMVSFKMGSNENVNIESPADVAQESEGILEYDWSKGDTSNLGFFSGRFVVKMIDGNQIKLPTNGSIDILIQDEL